LIKPVKDYAEPKGTVKDGVIYSSTVAMLPNHKESAYKHLPTYIGGIIFHIGILTAIVLIILQLIIPNFMHSAALGKNYDLEIEMLKLGSKFTSWTYVEWLRLIFGVGLIISACCGMGMLIKRITNKELKHLSTPDDYISNILVTLFLLSSALAMLFPVCSFSKPLVFIIATLMFIYIPFGKLRHFLYFFSARYQLGVFFGKRGAWSMKNNKNNK
jgi:nitrate reductase gamma subunit